jgi:hypothetical protein
VCGAIISSGARGHEDRKFFEGLSDMDQAAVTAFSILLSLLTQSLTQENVVSIIPANGRWIIIEKVSDQAIAILSRAKARVMIKSFLFC